MADPTTAQRKQLAKMGIAMPDGSFYIRNGTELDDAIHAVGRAQPETGQSDVARRNEVRRHIITRAKALNLSSKIPGTWNADGSLKPSAVAMGEAFITQFGVKGMHWGVRKDQSNSNTSEQRTQKIDKKIASHQATHDAHIANLKLFAKHVNDLEQNGANSEAFKLAYGKGANLSELAFQFKYGQSKGQAALQLRNEAVRQVNYAAKRADHHEKEIRKLQDKKNNLDHSDLDISDFDVTKQDLLELVLSHFGVKGMHWGVRNSKGASSGDSSEASKIAAKAKAGGGIHVLSNDELRTLNERRNLESNHNRLSAPSNKSASKILEDILKEAGKQEAKKYASQYAAKGADWLAKEGTKFLVSQGKHAA